MTRIDECGVIRRYPPRGRWVERAACLDANPALFYSVHAVHLAREICRGCDVTTECLAYALKCEAIDPYGGHGVWGGLTAAQRAQLRTYD